MIEANQVNPIVRLPTTPRAIASMVAVNCYVPVIYNPDRSPESARFERLPRKAKPSPDEALRYAQRVIYFRILRTNEARRRLAAISDTWWLEVVAGMYPRQLVVHRPVNRDRTEFQGWGNR